MSGSPSSLCRASIRSICSVLIVPAMIVLAIALAAPTTWEARAQLQLHGGPAAPATPSAGAGGGGEPSYAPPKPIVIKPPNAEAIAGHTLAQDGTKGAMVLDKAGDGLVLSRLSLTGDKISASNKPCSVDVALTPPLALKEAGRPVGAIRYEVPLQVCPFSVDVLDGAALVSMSTPSCDFPAADCRVSLAGLWGPTAAEITDKRAKELVRERVRIETTMRADFRLLLKRAGKDRAAVKALAREQAGFSSAREMACRDYAQESVHGFCSTQITQARVLALLSKFGGDLEAHEDRKHATHERPKPRSSPANPPVDEPPADLGAEGTRP